MSTAVERQASDGDAYQDASGIEMHLVSHPGPAGGKVTQQPEKGTAGAYEEQRSDTPMPQEGEQQQNAGASPIPSEHLTDPTPSLTPTTNDEQIERYDSIAEAAKPSAPVDNAPGQVEGAPPVNELANMNFKATDALIPKTGKGSNKHKSTNEPEEPLLTRGGDGEAKSAYQKVAMDIGEDAEGHEREKGLGMIESISLNTLMMFGTGPFITIPFCIASTDPAGPQALIGYAIGGLACVCDSFVWAELGALFPYSGGTYVYAQACIGDTWGRYLSFLFLWQLLITGPMEVASGFIAIAQYLAYITQTYTYLHHSLVAFAFCVSCIILLYRDMKDVGHTSVILWIGMCAAIAFTLTAGYTHFDSENLALPEIPSSKYPALIWSLGNAARFGIYDFTGYYDINFMGNEIRNPTRVIPKADTYTCIVVCAVYFLTYIAVMAYLPWDPAEGGYVGLVENGGNAAAYIMSIFCEKMIGRGFAVFFTLVVVFCIYGSCFSLLLGFAQVPYAAATSGMFFRFFAHEHAKDENGKGGFADHSLLFMGVMSCVFCFVDLAMVIEGMMTTTICTMFLANSLSLVVHRKRFPNLERPYEMPLYPLPVIIQVVMFSFVFLTSDNYIIMGSAPLLEFGLLFLLAGTFVFLGQSKAQGLWPFEKVTPGGGEEIASESE